MSGVSTDQSKQASKEFPLSFEEQGFSLMPPKFEGWMSRRAKEKGVSKVVSARVEALVRTQLKIMDFHALSAGSKMDLEWWVENLEKANDKEFFPKIPDMEIHSDASLSGWGPSLMVSQHAGLGRQNRPACI